MSFPILSDFQPPVFRRRYAVQTVETVPQKLAARLNVLTRTMKLKQVKLWWPAGQGSRHRYYLQVKLGDDEASRKIGLRSLQIMTVRDSDGGGIRIPAFGR